MLPPYTLDPPQPARLPSGPESRFGALIPVTTDLVSGNPYGWQQPQAPQMHAPNVSAANLAHSLRRKWWVGAGIGLLMGIAFAILAWFYVPVKQKAEVAIYLGRDAGSPLDPVRHSMAKDEYEAFKNTQAAMLRHKNTLEKALQETDPDTGLEISRLPEVLKHPDPVAWLEGALDINFPQESELMFVALKGEDAKQLTKIVNMICSVYVSQVKESNSGQDKQRLAELRAKHEQTTNDIQSTENKLNELAEALGYLDKEALQATFQARLSKLTQLNSQITNWESRKSEQEIQSLTTSAALEHAKNREPSDGELEEELMKDKAYEEKVKRRDITKEVLKQLEGKTKNPESAKNVKRMRVDLDNLEQDLEEYREEKRPLIRDRLQSPGEIAKLTAELAAYGQAIEQLDGLIKTARAEADKLQQQMNLMGQRQPEVESLQNKLALLKEDARTMQAAVLKLEIVQVQPDRIRRYGDVTKTEDSGELMKYLAVGFAGFFGFCVPMIGITFWDFQQHRVNNPQDASSNLGMKILGAFPAVAGRRNKSGKPDAKTVALQRTLGDCADGVRTALMRDTAAEGTRVLLVTSAVHHEGKTTLATQLASSVARAGKRTLLIDGDLRKPGAHRMYGLSLDPGLCEVLRGECEIEETIRPTRSSGLWMMTAGRCDDESLHDLAKEGLGDIFTQLRSGFDYIIIDGSPVLATADALVIGQYVDAAVISVLRDASRVPNVFEAADRLRGVGIRVLGTVFNGSKRDVRPQKGQKKIAGPKASKPAKTAS